MNITVQPSAQALPLASFPCFMNAGTASKLHEEISKDELCCPGINSKTGLGTNVQGGETTANGLPFVEAVKPPYLHSSSSATVTVSARDCEGDHNSKRNENTLMPQGRSIDGLIQMDARNTTNVFGQSSADQLSDTGKGLPDMIGHTAQESGNNLASCSWLYEGSNDSFVQRIWAIEVIN